MTATRIVAASFAVSVFGSIALVVVYLAGGNVQLEGILLGLALGGMGIGVVVWAIRLLAAPIDVEERHPLVSPAEAREAEAAPEAEVTTISRRHFLVKMLGGAGAALVAALALPVFSLGPQPGRALFQTPWRPGVRVVCEDGMPIRPDEIGLETVRTVFPEGAVGSADGATLLIKVRPSDLRLAGERMDWAPEGVVGYSKICTHAGCPVGLYRAEDNALLCPCHQSTFDVLRGAVPTFGPAARPLPQLPMEVGADGFLVARGDFPEPIGPSFWNLTHDGDPALLEDADPADVSE